MEKIEKKDYKPSLTLNGTIITQEDIDKCDELNESEGSIWVAKDSDKSD